MAQSKESSQEGEDLLVFGYACKLFRDDEKASMIDGGQHLIPWMGDESLKIDRYDGRGALYDLVSHEAKPNTWEQMTLEELEVERKCDKERYRFLNSDAEEEALYQEEESKRVSQATNAYAQVSYVYEENTIAAEEEEVVRVNDDKPFLAPPDLAIPEDMTVPDTMRLHAIIERTALFISEQGPQMEIIMKLKQHGNKQFDFMSHNDPLYPYYKFILSSIKSGTYTPCNEEKWPEDEGNDELEDGNYLHPSLASKPYRPPTPPVEEGPPPAVEKIIEAMVKYVAKNGLAFEALIRRRNESRFSFLEPTDKYHSFYQEKLAEAPKSDKWDEKPKVEKEPPAQAADEDSNSSDKSHLDSSGTKRKPNPVCFSIKKAKENEGLEVPSALPLEDSSDEEKGEQPQQPMQPPVQEKPAEVLPVKESPIESDDSDLGVVVVATKRRKSGSRKRKSSSKEKDIHIQKERKLKVAQFLKSLKSKQS